MLALVGALRLGSLIRHIPHAVTVGFTAGHRGDHPGQPDQGPGRPDARAAPSRGRCSRSSRRWARPLPTLNPAALALGLGVAAVILVLRRLRPDLARHAGRRGRRRPWRPRLLHLPVETIGSRFGGIPHGLPAPHAAGVVLGAADRGAAGGAVLHPAGRPGEPAVGQGRRRHDRPRAPLEHGAGRPGPGQCRLGPLRRDRRHRHDRAHGRPTSAPAPRSPVAGMLHAAFLLVFMLVAAPLASYVPLAALAGHAGGGGLEHGREATEFASLLTNWRAAAVLLATFGLTILHDLMAGILAGCGLAVLFWAASQAAPKAHAPLTRPAPSATGRTRFPPLRVAHGRAPLRTPRRRPDGRPLLRARGQPGLGPRPAPTRWSGWAPRSAASTPAATWPRCWRKLKPDVCFNALHGEWGEDGCVQGVLETLAHPLHPLRRAGLGAGHGQGQGQGGAGRGRRRRCRAAACSTASRWPRDHVMPPPYVVKPNAEGSSVGVFIVHDGANRPPQEVVAPVLDLRRGGDGRALHPRQGAGRGRHGRQGHDRHRNRAEHRLLRLRGQVRRRAARSTSFRPNSAACL